MKLEIKSIGIWSLIKVSVFINMIVGFMFGVFYAMMISFMSTAGLLPMDLVGNEDITLLGLLIIVPIMFSIGAAVLGTIWCVICVFIYNLLARIVGGLEINTEDISVKENIPQPQQAATTLINKPYNVNEVASPLPAPPLPTRDMNNSLISEDDNKKDKGPDTNYEI